MRAQLLVGVIALAAGATGLLIDDAPSVWAAFGPCSLTATCEFAGGGGCHMCPRDPVTGAWCCVRCDATTVQTAECAGELPDCDTTAPVPDGCGNKEVGTCPPGTGVDCTGYTPNGKKCSQKNCFQ